MAFDVCSISIISMNPAQNQIYAKISDDHAQDGENAVNVEKQGFLEGFP